MKAAMSFSTHSPHLSSIEGTVNRRLHSPSLCLQPRKFQDKRWNTKWSPNKEERRNRSTEWKVNSIPDWPLMAVMVEHVLGSRDWVVTKSVWHLNDEEIKNVYTMYIMFTCWGCCFFASMKDPFYDGESYRKDGGDGSVHWLYEKQEDIEEQARAELWREELIEEIEKKVGGLRELEEAKEEELVK
uniref:Photosynthetic NDH subcomplex B 4 n=1 Tax=Goodyera fumata TaxID=1390594 RepID=A0A0F7CYS2_9ASPA